MGEWIGGKVNYLFVCRYDMIYSDSLAFSFFHFSFFSCSNYSVWYV